MTYHWQTKKEQMSHADDWLITYADMITLLLCFFVIFVIVSIPKKEALMKVATQHSAALAEPLTTPAPASEAQKLPPLPDVFQNNAPFHKIDDEDYPSVVPEVAANADHPAVVADPIPPEVTTVAQVEMAPVETPPALPPQMIENLKAHTDAQVEQKGDRLTTVEMNSAAFFERGSAVLSEKGKSILQDVGLNLKEEQFKDYQITIEGHTDDTPIHTAQFPSNWELSTARASAVLHFLLNQGIPAAKLRAAGYADTFPKKPNRDGRGIALPQNQAENRRVVIKLEKIEKTQ